jgi:thioredoxin-related protein
MLADPARAQTNTPARSLPLPADLRQVATAASARGEPVVVMVSLPGCPWCELLRRNYLVPMRQEGLAAFEFLINDQRQVLKGFDSRLISPAALSEALKIRITPTIVFFNAQGQEVAPRLEGVASAQMIGDVLGERLSSARQRIQSQRESQRP